MNIDEINNKLKVLLKPKRYIHSISVADCAKRISSIYNCDEDRAYLAGLVHDCAKNLTKEEIDYYTNKYNIELDEFEVDNINLSHGIIGSYIAKYEFFIEDEEILSAIKYHTTGTKNMTILEKIVYIADLIEDNRNFEGIDEIRYLVYKGKIDTALLISLDNTIKIVVNRGQIIHPRTINARNYLIQTI